MFQQGKVIFKKQSGLNYYKKKKFFLLLKKLFLPGFFLIFLSSAFYFFLLSSYFRIADITIQGPQGGIIDESLIRTKINSFFQNQNYGFFFRGNWFLFQPERLEAELLSQIPRIENIKIDKKFPKTLAIEIQEREMAGIYCNKFKIQNSKFKIKEELGSEEFQDNCFYFDKNGIIFDEAPAGGGSLILRIKDPANPEAELGEVVLSKEIVEGLSRIKKTLAEDQTIFIQYFDTIDEGGFLAKTGEGFEIYFDVNEDINLQILSLREVLAKMPDEERNNLEYADLRVRGKVYYK